jgi:rhodanese-related sulfurtransferase
MQFNVTTRKETEMSKQIEQLSRGQLQARIAANPGLLLLEALPEKYYREGHLSGARHMPHDQVAEFAPRLAPARDAEIVVYCASKTCQNSHIAADHLVQLGYSWVAVYAGGKQDWVEAGLPLEAEEVAAV